MPDLASELQSRLQFAIQAAAAASEWILGFYQSTSLVVDRKRDTSPVTEADRGAERLLSAEIARAFPGDAILGEEYGETPGTSGYRWILDPVDGTKSFIHGVPLFGTLLGLEHAGECVVGVCRFPALDEVIYAATGQGAWWQKGRSAPIPARVSHVSELADALFCITTISGWDRLGQRSRFDRLCAAAGLTRGWGDCYGHILVATGRADVMIDPAMNAWDAAALLPILREAGGTFVDWAGQETIYSGNGLSVNGALRDKILTILGQD